MNHPELRAHQLRAVEALKLLDRVCAENNITYFMIAGSALGAVRHRGFIPWDDDIDVVMTMDQYQRFLEIAPKAIRAPYCWKHTSVDPEYPRLTGSISYGDDESLITLFPLVKLSDNQLQRKMQWIIRKVMSPVWQRKVGYRVPPERMNAKQRVSIAVSTVLAVFLPGRAVLGMLRRNEMRYENRNVESYCNLYSKYSQEKESIRAEWVKELIRVPFEDGEFPILKAYDAYLTHLYGDYMTPPPESEQHPEHT